MDEPERPPQKPGSRAAFALTIAPALVGGAAFLLTYVRFRAVGPVGAHALLLGWAACFVGGLISAYAAGWLPGGSTRRRWAAAVAAVAIVAAVAVLLYPFVVLAVTGKPAR